MYNFYDNKNKKLISFDDNLVIEKSLDLNCTDDFCIDDKGFALLSAINDERTPIKLNDNVLVVGRAKIKTLPNRLININKDFDNEVTIKIDNLREAAKFISNNQVKSVLCGVCVNQEGSIAATDGFKVYFLDNGGNFDKSVILEGNLTKEICKYSGECQVSYNENTIRAIVNGAVIYGKIIVGKYPDIRRIINLPEFSLKRSFDINNLKEIIEIGKLVGDSVKVYINDNTITFEGDNEYAAAFDGNFKVYMTLEFLNLIVNFLSDSNNDYSFYYIDNAKPLKFVKYNKNVVILPLVK